MSRELEGSELPSAQGLIRYPHTAGYNVDLVDPVACTCKDACLPRCAGECGCDACSLQFSSFCDMAGFYNAVPTSDEEALALARYRGEFTP
jgi:hypothetical protein